MGKKFYLRAISLSDQAFPCSFGDENSWCSSRSTFRVYPSCACNTDLWPNTQSCTKHLAKVVVEASKRCTGHWSADRVMVKPVGSAAR